MTQQDHLHHSDEASPAQSFWRSKVFYICLSLFAAALFFLLNEHWGHVFGVLPYLFLLACPLIHIFMHGGHGGHDHHDQGQPGIRNGQQ